MVWGMTLQDDAAALSELVRSVMANHRRQEIVATSDLINELLDLDNIATRIRTAAAALQLSSLTRLDFPSVDAKVVRAVPEEDRWMIRRGAYNDQADWAWDIANNVWIAAPAALDLDDTGFLAATFCSLDTALAIIAGMGEAAAAGAPAKTAKGKR